VLPLGCVPRSLAIDLREYFAERVTAATKAGVQQKTIAKEAKVSTATVSTLRAGKKGGLRLDNAEKLAGYFGMDLLAAVAAAKTWGDGRAHRAQFTHREEAVKQLGTALDPDIRATLRGYTAVDLPWDPPVSWWIQRAVDMIAAAPPYRAPAEPLLLPPKPEPAGKAKKAPTR
jgi:transcriptional regulator with XRE-family HTH domain